MKIVVQYKINKWLHLVLFMNVMPDQEKLYICVCLCSVLQEACSALWSEEGQNAIIHHYEVECNEVQTCDGYDVIKLAIASLTSVSIKQLTHD